MSDGEVQRGVLLCGTGLGMSYAANRYPHVRAAVAWTPEIAKLAREHNDANVLVLPARFVDEAQGVEILKTWLDTPFEGGRHARRVDKDRDAGSTSTMNDLDEAPPLLARRRAARRPIPTSRR